VGQGAVMFRIVYILVCLSALWPIISFAGILTRGEIRA
jgi:uncharacterized membrane protein YuzA (DUF378 family)